MQSRSLVRLEPPPEHGNPIVAIFLGRRVLICECGARFEDHTYEAVRYQYMQHWKEEVGIGGAPWAGMQKGPLRPECEGM